LLDHAGGQIELVVHFVQVLAGARIDRFEDQLQ